MIEFQNMDAFFAAAGVSLLAVYTLAVGYGAVTRLNSRVEMQGLLALIVWLAGMALLVVMMRGFVPPTDTGGMMYVPAPAVLVLPAFLLAVVHLITALRQRRGDRG